MINIVLFGAPGCGKGTQTQRLKAHYGIEHVSTGEVIRDEIRRGTELGRSMESYIKAGKLAPDEIVIGMVANYVSEHKHVKGCIFDGFPRTTVQAEEFDKLLARHGLKVDIMVDIHVPEEELVQRILLRAGRVSLEPLRDREQIFDFSESRDGFSDLREWLAIFLQEAQRALARSVVACGQEVELGCPLA